MIIENKYLKYRKIYKARQLKNFYIYYKKQGGVQLYALHSLKLFLIHLKVLSNLIKRSAQQLIILTRKEKFRQSKKYTGIFLTKLKRYDLLMRKYKTVFFYLSLEELRDIAFPKFKTKNLDKRRCVYLNLYLLPYTRKAIGSRMGKGTGGLKTWFMRIESGWPILSFLFWPFSKLIYLLKQLQRLLPGSYRYSFNFLTQNRGQTSYNSLLPYQF